LRPEILAPAGTFEALTAAAVCGADAVYLGGKALNARRNADNFDEDALARAVAYCHARGVKVFQTLNTILFDDETDELLAAAETAAALGIDGAIVQDLGVLRLLKAAVPDLPLCASTQMAVHNLAGAREAERLGCAVIVLARELTAQEIGRITRSLKTAKTEVFVHGALCMSVSGQCYLSAMLGGRSGNRGLCAQPCRLPFAAGASTHALSLKDLSLAGRVSELAGLGVASLKIEGRMKRPEYVAAAVTAVREARSGGAPDLQTLQSVFSRSGFTSGYFDGCRDARMFGTRRKEDVTAAADVLDRLGRLARQETPRVALTGRFSAAANEAMSLTVSDADGHTRTVCGETPQAAQSRPTDAARVRQSLEKTGGTPFFWASLEIDLADGLFCSAAALNALRRDALAQIETLRAAPRPLAFFRPAPDLPAPAGHAPPRLRARVRREQISRELIGCCDELSVPFDAVETALAMGADPARLLVEIPRILFEGEDRIPAALAEAKALGVTRAWCGNLGAIPLAREAGFTVCGGWSLNIANTHALLQLCDMGAADTEVSFELSAERMRRLGDALPFGAVAYGFLPLMVYRNCPMKAAVGCGKCRKNGGLTDRTGTRFRLSCESGAPELFNSVPLWLADRAERFPADFLTLWFTNEPAQRCAAVAAQYAGRAPAEPPRELTRGLYYRAVP